MLKRFLIPATGTMIVDDQLLTYWAIEYEEHLLGTMARLRFFASDGGCDGKILDWLYADCPQFMRTVIENTQKEITSWYKPPRKSSKTKQKRNNGN